MKTLVPKVSDADRKLAAQFGLPDQIWQQVDLELNRQKNTDPLRQREADRAMREELRLPASVRP